MLEVFYGGAAGGGKSDAILMAALEYVDQPNYAGLILRRTYAQLDMPDSILDRAKKWLKRFPDDVKWVEKKMRFEFKSGAVLQFGYLQYDGDVYQYDGPSYQFIGFDELTQFTEFQYKFMFGRLRRLVGSTIPLRMRSASNPGNVGHVWVLNRFVKYRGPDRLFIPAQLEDNPYADLKSYDDSLNKLDRITRLQRRYGDWEVSLEGSRFKRVWFQKFADRRPENSRRCRFWDLAASEGAGDWLVGTLLSVTEPGTWFVEDVVRKQPSPKEVYNIIHETAEVDGTEIPVRIEQEGGASGKVVINDLMLKMAGWDVKGEPSMKAKMSRWLPFANQCEHGNVVLLLSHWNEAWLDEMCSVPQAEHDDQADSVSGAFKVLTIDGPSDFGIDFVKGAPSRSNFGARRFRF